MASATLLSSNDSAVLGALFDPEASLSNGVTLGGTSPEPVRNDEFVFAKEEERRLLLRINEENFSEEDTRATILGLTKIVSKYPGYASAWNNRAQARRLLFKSDNFSSDPDELKALFADLDQAISLATPKSPEESVTETDSRVLASAHTHRGYLFWLASRSAKMAQNISAYLHTQQTLNGEALEELASRDFAIGGRYGNPIAKQLAVKTNPYAKLCGSIVREAMQKEIADYHQTCRN